MVWGPKSTGKSLGLQEMAVVWKNQGRVIIDIDLKDLVGGYAHFLDYFRTKVLQSLSDLALTADELRICFLCSSHLHNKTLIKPMMPNVLSRWLSDYGFESTAKFVDTANAKWAKDLDTYLQFIFATTDMALGVDFQGLLEFLELLTIQRPHVAPVIILRELQYLNAIGGKTYFPISFALSSPRSRGAALWVLLSRPPSTLGWKPRTFCVQLSRFNPIS